MNTQLIVKILTDAGIEENEAKKEVEMLIEHFCKITPEDLIKGYVLSAEQLELIKTKAAKRAENRIPIQYITGQAWFMGDYYKVTPDVLIPRDETEILAREAIRMIKENNFSDVLDIGTGSGCIACSVAKNTNATVLGVDISSDALRIALDNVTKLGINNKAVFRKSDLFDKTRSEEKFDLIISNPPYIPRGTILEPEIGYEPEGALFAGENGLEYYRKIIEKAPLYLKQGGYLMFELGINESGDVRKFMEKDFKNIYTIKDLSNIDRVIAGILK